MGSNFIPATAINDLEMWQADTFDPQEIDKEMGWAQRLGMNAMRVFCMIHRHEITARLRRAPSPPAFDVDVLDFLNQLKSNSTAAGEDARPTRYLEDSFVGVAGG